MALSTNLDLHYCLKEKNSVPRLLNFKFSSIFGYFI